MRIVAAFMVIALVTAGCLGNNSNGDEDDLPDPPLFPADWAARAVVTGEEHDHEDPAQHANLTTPNLEVVGWDPLVTDQHGRSSGSYLCGDVAVGDGARIGVVHSHLSSVAFVVVDLTDPERPRKIGELVMPSTYVYDLAITEDARFVALGTSAGDNTDTVEAKGSGHPFGDRPYYRDCNGAVHRVPLPALQDPLGDAPFQSGVVLVDLADPTEPAIADYTPMPVLGSHSIFASLIDGTYWILGATTNLQHTSSYFQFITVEELPTGPKMVVQSTYRPAPPTDGEQPYINGHVDGWIQEHPATGTLTAYLADWDGGLVLIDLSNPNMPTETGRWTNYAGHDPVGIYGDDSGSVHTALPMSTLWDGRHYTIIGQEVVGRPTDTPSGLIWVIDTTDVTDPQPVSAWTLPIDVLWSGTLMFSTHYVTVLEESRTMFVAMYHGGVWAVDLDNVTAPRSVGVFIPDHVSPAPAGDDLYPTYNWAPTVLDLRAIDTDLIAVWDGGSGVYTVRWHPDVVGPNVEEWPVTV